jgi:hypothetical protein
VVVPELITMRKSTLKLLEEFKASGGEVVFIGTPAKYIEAESSDKITELASNCPSAQNIDSELISLIENKGRRISITDDNNKEIEQTLYLLREDDNGFYLFVCNTGHKFRSDIKDECLARDRKDSFPSVTIKGFEGCVGTPVELDPESGKILAAEYKEENSFISIKTSLPALGSRMFYIPKDAKSNITPNADCFSVVDKIEKIETNNFKIKLSDYNTVVLDRPEYSIANRDWQKEEEILAVDKQIRSTLDIPERGGRMVQPWAVEKNNTEKSVNVMLKYKFNVENIPSSQMYLAVESPEVFNISINGNRLIPDSECGWWVDKSLRKISFTPSMLQKGKNEIILECNYKESFKGLEIIYLLGEFGVEVDKASSTIIEAPKTLECGDWVPQGMPFYSGNVGYEFDAKIKREESKKTFIKINNYAGVGAKIWVNGHDAGVIAWEPNELDITDYLRGENDNNNIIVEILGSRRNSHGPFHIPEKWPIWTGPASFGDEVKEFQLVPCGLMEAPEIIYKTK